MVSFWTSTGDWEWERGLDEVLFLPLVLVPISISGRTETSCFWAPQTPCSNIYINIYMTPLRKVTIQQHEVRWYQYADNIQLHISALCQPSEVVKLQFQYLEARSLGGNRFMLNPWQNKWLLIWGAFSSRDLSQLYVGLWYPRQKWYVILRSL